MAQPNWYRKCVGCGEAKHKRDLLRIVKYRDNQLEIDLKQLKPGRGAYICPTIACAQLSAKRNGLDRSFQIKVSKEFYDLLIEQVTKIEHGESNITD